MTESTNKTRNLVIIGFLVLIVIIGVLWFTRNDKQVMYAAIATDIGTGKSSVLGIGTFKNSEFAPVISGRTHVRFLTLEELSAITTAQKEREAALNNKAFTKEDTTTNKTDKK